jgi:hypothetical protein
MGRIVILPRRSHHNVVYAPCGVVDNTSMLYMTIMINIIIAGCEITRNGEITI